MRRGLVQRLLKGRHAVPVLAGLAATVLVALLQLLALGPLERVGLQLFDQYQVIEPREYEPAPVHVVDIDDASLAKLGQWPWSRDELARLVELLDEAGAAAIAFDFVFPERDRTTPQLLAGHFEREEGDAALARQLADLPDHDAIFAEALAEAPVVLGMILERDEMGDPFDVKRGIIEHGELDRGAMRDYAGLTQSIAPLRDAARGAGSVTYQSDGDGIVRQIPLVALQDGVLVPSLSLEALRLARAGENSLEFITSAASGESPGAPGAAVGVRVSELTVPSTADGRMWVHYTRPVEERVEAAWKLLEGAMTSEEMAEKYGGSFVFIGTSAAGLRDLVSTPRETNVPGVLVHAQALEQMLLGRHLVRPDWAVGMELVLVLLLGGGLALMLPRLGATRGALVGAAGILAVAASSWLAFSQGRFLFDPTYPALAIVLVYTIETALIFWREERERAYIHGAFDKYLSPELVRQIADDPGKLELGGEEREMSVLVCDIRGFSRISEKYGPRQVIDFLIDFLTPMSDVLIRYGATIDKYMGDAILAFWNAPLDDPDHQRNAARAALAMVETLDELNRDKPDAGGGIWPGQVRIGIGLNTGICCVGNMGSRRRLSYSLIGDPVNLAARLEGQTKHYGVPIVLGSGIARYLDGFALFELDRIRVVGRKQPDTIFALFGDEQFARRDELHAIAELHGRMLAAYRASDWTTASQILEERLSDYVNFGLDRLNALFRNRIAELQANPPEAGWEGIFESTTK